MKSSPLETALSVVCRSGGFKAQEVEYAVLGNSFWRSIELQAAEAY